MTHHDRRGFGGVHGLPASLYHHSEAGDSSADAPTRQRLDALPEAGRQEVVERL